MWGAIVLGLVASVALRRWRWPIAIGFFLAAAIHLIRIWPYVPIAAEQLALGRGRQDDSCFSALALNVKMDNLEYSRVADMIEVESPDVLLLMETNAAWTRALARALAAYPYRMTRPLDNYYGIDIRKPGAGGERPCRLQHVVEHPHAVCHPQTARRLTGRIHRPSPASSDTGAEYPIAR